MVGAGQLARMTHQAAIGLGVELVVLADSGEAPAATAGAHVRLGAPDDLGALHGLAAATDVVTFDHERIPPAHLADLEHTGYVLRPTPAAKALAQDKLLARRAVGHLGLPVPRFAPARTEHDVVAFAEDAGWPVVLKARTGGYDGRGVHVVAAAHEAASALAACSHDAVVEEHVAIATELAVLVARRDSGETAAYPVVETVQHEGMCRELVAPARVDADVVTRARKLALTLAVRAGVTGLMAVELFHTDDSRLVVNELALRPHNAGHWTIEGAETSQFEQHLRAVLDWPLGATALRAPAVATVNVVGASGADPAGRLGDALAVAGAHVHLYGKEPRPGRKLGHVTALAADPDRALATAHAAAARLVAP
jgi:5-(carboxyamino)imidazole ribonucleotide synthase